MVEARALVADELLVGAVRAARRGLEARPDDAPLHRALARALEAQGRSPEALEYRERAERLAPSPPPPPEAPVPHSSRDVVVALLRPDPAHPDPARVPGQWPDPVVAEALEQRLRVRLSEASIVHREPGSVAEARRWLAGVDPRSAMSLRVERAFCDATVKDGPFAVAWLRLAAAVPDGRPGQAELVKQVVSDPQLPGGCRREVVSRALERALELPQVERALRAPAPPRAPRAPSARAHRWSAGAIRSLFPDLGRRIEEELATGRRWMRAGQVAKAGEAFHRAAHIDPEDPDVRAYLRETSATLEMSAQLGDAAGEPGVLAPRMTARQRSAMEALLAEERRRRDELLATLAVLDEDVRAPEPRLLGLLHEQEIGDGEAFGPRLARARGGDTIVRRAAYAPDGTWISRYYLAAGEVSPVVREEDTSGDGRADRWVAYEGGARREIYEDGLGRGRPDLRIVFEPGGEVLDRIELDLSGDGQADRVFQYVEGQLAVESLDTNGDGHLDRFDRLDGSGQLAVREEDRNGDGEIDVRSVFEDGRLVRREFARPESAPET